MRLGIREFSDNPGGNVKLAVQSSEPISLTFHGADYATINPAAIQRRLEMADDIVQGLLQLARREADCAEYQAYAEAIDQMARTGHLDIPPAADGAPTMAT